MSHPTPTLIPNLFDDNRLRRYTSPMPTPSRPPVRKTYREVELVRLYTEGGHPWLGLVALALRMGVIGAVLLALIGIARVVVERFL